MVFKYMKIFVCFALQNYKRKYSKKSYFT